MAGVASTRFLYEYETLYFYPKHKVFRNSSFLIIQKNKRAVSYSTARLISFVNRFN